MQTTTKQPADLLIYIVLEYVAHIYLTAERDLAENKVEGTAKSLTETMLLQAASFIADTNNLVGLSSRLIGPDTATVLARVTAENVTPLEIPAPSTTIH